MTTMFTLLGKRSISTWGPIAGKQPSYYYPFVLMAAPLRSKVKSIILYMFVNQLSKMTD